MNQSTDGVFFAHHGGGLYKKSWSQIESQNSHRKYKVSKLSDLMAKTAEYGLQINLDIRMHSPWNDAAFSYIANLANSLHAKVTIKASTAHKELADALPIAQKHGFWVRSNKNPYAGNGWKAGVWHKPTATSASSSTDTVETGSSTSASSSSAACCPASATPATASALLEGNDNEEKAWKLLTGEKGGLSAEQAAGVMGNIAVESHFDPKAKNGSSFTGISQWSTGGRWAALVKWAKGQNLDQWSFDTQIQYTLKEGTDRKNIAGIKKYTDVPHTAWYWGRYFEVAIVNGSTSETPLTNVQDLKLRTEAAQTIFNKYSGTPVGSSAGSTSAASSCPNEIGSSVNASCSNVDAKPPDDFEHTTFPGTSQKTDKRTLYMVNVANDCLKQLGEKPVTVIQGSYCAGSCAGASGSSHDKGATLDIRTKDRGGHDKIMKLLKVLREVGFAAWYRDGGDNPSFGGNEHIHAVALGAPLTGPNAPGSPDQLILYCTGGDGLKGGQKDRQLAAVGRPLPEWALHVNQIVQGIQNDKEIHNSVSNSCMYCTAVSCVGYCNKSVYE